MAYDIIGDIHGCYDELIQLIEKLGYRANGDVYRHPKGRKLAFVGDATDRGPDSLAVLRLLFNLQDAGALFYSPGNHCNKLYRYLRGNAVQLTHGLETTVNEFHQLSTEEQIAFRKRYKQFYESLPPYLELEPDLIVAHAGIKESMIGMPLSGKIWAFVLYGDTTGKFLPDGRPVRRDWAASYGGSPFIVYGHTPTAEPYIKNNTANIDTGCVFGGRLSAFRYPEKTVVSVPSQQPYQPDRFHSFI